MYLKLNIESVFSIFLRFKYIFTMLLQFINYQGQIYNSNKVYSKE